MHIVANQIGKTRTPEMRAYISATVSKSRVRENDSGNIAQNNGIKDKDPKPSFIDSNVIAKATTFAVQRIRDATFTDNTILSSNATILPKNNEIPPFATSVGIGKVKPNQVDPKTTLKNNDINVNVTSITPRINEKNRVTPIIDIGANRIKRIDAKTPLTNNESRSFADVVFHIQPAWTKV